MGAGLRRGYRGVLAALCALAVLAGCGSLPAGVDGDLTDNWPAFGDAVIATPVAGTCYDIPFNTTWFGDFDSKKIDCGKPHKIETFFVGTFTGALAEAENPPAFAGGDRAPTFSECVRRAEDFLGGPWQTGYLKLGLTTPSSAGWRGGARWFTCNMVPLTRDMDQDETSMTGSAKDGLRGDRPLARGCLMVADDANGYLVKEDSIPCSQPHNSEFAGLYTLHTSSYEDDQTARWRQESLACQAAFARFLGVSYNSSNYFGYFYDDITLTEWNLGVRTGVCALIGYGRADSPNKIRFTGSVKGIGNRKPTGWTGG